MLYNTTYTSFHTPPHLVRLSRKGFQSNCRLCVFLISEQLQETRVVGCGLWGDLHTMNLHRRSRHQNPGRDVRRLIQLCAGLLAGKSLAMDTEEVDGIVHRSRPQWSHRRAPSSNGDCRVLSLVAQTADRATYPSYLYFSLRSYSTVPGRGHEQLQQDLARVRVLDAQR